MIRVFFLLLVVAYLPGALIFRMPVLGRDRRAALPAEERLFWSVLLTLILSSFLALGLAAAGRYQFDRLLLANLGLSLGVRFGPSAPSPTLSSLIPLGLLTAGLWLNFFVPPAEYVMGGKDPGVYINEGIQIGQRGSLVIRDDTVSTLPAPLRGLFFKQSSDPTYYSNRFMGFFLLDPQVGSVVGQFPHMYPVWVAIGYGINGLNGARQVLGLWAALGLLAVYFLGTRVVGRAAATAGAALLAVNVVQIWYARYPNAEMVLQPLVFAAVLAYIRAQADEDRFFAPVAGLLLVLGAFTHLTGALTIVALGGAAVVAPCRTRSARVAFWLPLILGTSLAGVYLATYIPPYFDVPIVFVTTLGNIPPYFGIPVESVATLRLLSIAILIVAALVGVALWRATRHVPVAVRVRSIIVGLIAAGWMLAIYAYFFRTAVGLLAPHDADSLRHFAAFYLTPFGLALAVVGFGLVADATPAGFAFFLTATTFSLFTFFKIRIIPEHFWAARRFIAVILPSALLFVGAVAFSDVRLAAGFFKRREVRMLRYALGLVAVLLLGRHFLDATQPILRHVEYAGLIPRLEQLASTIGDDDLAVVESRAGSDVHVLALPLAYIYARHVLVLAETTPDKAVFREFLTWAHARYRRVFFIGGGGTELLSRTMTVRAIRGERFQIPEYESVRNAYPTKVRFKEFDLGVYEFLPTPAPTDGFDLDVGTADDLYVRRFHAKEQSSGGFSFRWTRDVSYVSIVGAHASCQRLTVWLSGSGRPPGAGEATVDMFLNNRPLGTVTAGTALAPYRFSIPPDLAASLERSEDAAQLRLVSRTWSPRRLLGVADDRELGVMLDRVTLECAGDGPAGVLR